MHLSRTVRREHGLPDWHSTAPVASTSLFELWVKFDVWKHYQSVRKIKLFMSRITK